MFTKIIIASVLVVYIGFIIAYTNYKYKNKKL